MIRKIKNNSRLVNRLNYDVLRIQQVLLQNNYESNYEDAANLWYDHSNTRASAWLQLPNNDNDLWEVIKEQVELNAEF